eukprot:GILJ01001595.1.p1 GENE.GILJ01001595.1~~GILJ01001595.1.p1  ORF type:complete len:503 (+),score=77.03 GILJ01001595.1:38-1546(+)
MMWFHYSFWVVALVVYCLCLPAATTWGQTLSYFLVATVSYRLMARQLHKPRAPTSKDRALSFSSSLMAKGTFPPRYNIPHAIVQSALFFDALPTLEDIKAVVKEKLLIYHRLCSVCEIRPSGEVVFKATDVNIDDHIVTASVENDQHLMAYLDQLCVRPVDMTKPLWDLHVIRNASGRSVLVPRVHHAVGDGLSMVNVFMFLFTDSEGGALSPPSFLTAQRPVHSQSTGEKIVSFLKTALGLFTSIVKVLSLAVGASDSPAVFRDVAVPFQWSDKRHLVMASNIDLQQLRMLKSKSHTTINDVVSACVAGSLRRYMEHRQDPLLQDQHVIRIRGLLPVAFPRPPPSDQQRPDSLRNRWCFISCHLPVHVPVSDPTGRLLAAKAELDVLKASPEAVVQYKIQELASAIMPFELQGQTALDVMLKHSVVFTNVPGPTSKIYFGGRPVESIYVFLGNVIPQISAFSYNGKLSVTWVVDPEVVTDSELLADFFVQELNALTDAFAS